MKITLKAEIQKYTSHAELATICVKAHIQKEGQPEKLGNLDMVFVPAKNAEKIAALINEQP